MFFLALTQRQMSIFPLHGLKHGFNLLFRHSIKSFFSLYTSIKDLLRLGIVTGRTSR